MDERTEVDAALILKRSLSQLPPERAGAVNQAFRNLATEDMAALLFVLASHLPASHIVSTPDVLGGKPRIDGRRISVQDVAIWHERMGMSVDEIATNYDLTLGQIYAALAYYYDHREAIDERIRQARKMIEELKALHPSDLQARLAEQRNG